MSRKATLWSLNLSVFVMMLGIGAVMPLLPGRIVAFSGSTAAVGYIASSFALSYLVLQLPMGSFSDRLGFKRFLIAGYLLCALSGVVYYFADSMAMIFLGRVVQGAGEAPLWALGPAMLSLHFPESRGRVIGQYNATIHIGLTFGPLLGIVALRLGANDLPFVLFSAACLLSAVIVYFLAENAPREEGFVAGRFDLKNITLLVSSPPILAALLGITLYGAGYGIFITTLPAYLSHLRGYEQTYVQLFFTCFYIAVSVSQIVAGSLSDHWGREKFMVGGLAATAVFLFIFPHTERWTTLFVLTLASLGLGVFYLASLAFLNAYAPDSLKGTISGAYFLFWGFGYFAGPVVIGYLGEMLQRDAGFYFYVVLLLADVLAMALLFRRAPRLNA